MVGITKRLDQYRSAPRCRLCSRGLQERVTSVVRRSSARWLTLACMAVAGWLASANNVLAQTSTTGVAKTGRLDAKQMAQVKKEAAFKKLMNNAVLDGLWQVTGAGGLSGTEPLSKPKPERYAITSAEKVADDSWIIKSRIQYGDKDVTVPILVRIVWAEDTPILTINELAIPMIGTYSARVMFHHGFYSGVWYSKGNNYGGILAGRIRKQNDIATDKKKSEEDGSAKRK